ncbi:Arthropsin, partial [Ladona fulva]
IWFYCALMSAPPLLGWSRYIAEGFLTSCSWDYLTRTPANRAYYIYLLTLGFVAPVCIILTLVLLFLTSWTPYSVVSLIGQFGDIQRVTPWTATLPAIFAKASVIYNPIVYGLSHPHFRSSVRQYLSAHKTIANWERK